MVLQNTAGNYQYCLRYASIEVAVGDAKASLKVREPIGPAAFKRHYNVVMFSASMTWANYAT